MITIDPYKKKQLSFSFTVEGIDPSNLQYNLRLSSDTYDFGVVCEAERGEIVAKIPPLVECLSKEKINELKNIKLEINDRGNKYYIKPFEDEINIKKEPKIAVTVTEEKDEKEGKEDKLNLNIENINESSHEEEKTPKREPKKKKYEPKSKKLYEKLVKK